MDKLSEVWESAHDPQVEFEVPKGWDFHIVFHHHDTIDGAHQITEHLHGADAFIPEGCGWNLDFLDDINAVANGELLPEAFASNNYLPAAEDIPESREYWRIVAEALYQSGIPIRPIDVPGVSEGISTAIWLLESVPSIDKIRSTGWDKSLENIAQALEVHADLQRTRENFMLSLIEPQLSRFGYSTEQRKAVVSLGAAHTRVYQLLHQKAAQEGFQVSRSFPNKPYIFDRWHAALRSEILGRDDTLDIPRLYGDIFAAALISVIPDLPGETHASIVRDVVDRLSDDDIRVIHELRDESRADLLPYAKAFEVAMNESIKKHSEVDTCIKIDGVE